MLNRLKAQSGFTLIEILIVIIVLGILAMIIVPQITVSTDDAKLSTLQSDLASLRSTIEIYYAQHKNKYPGQTTAAGGAANTDATVAAADMVKQLTQYTDENGQVAAARDDTTFKFGPYIKGGSLPANPFNDGTDVVCDNSPTITDARAATAAAGIGWKFHFVTGVLYANDTTEHAAY